MLSTLNKASAMLELNNNCTNEQIHALIYTKKSGAKQNNYDVLSEGK